MDIAGIELTSAAIEAMTAAISEESALVFDWLSSEVGVLATPITWTLLMS